jgi:uncharacterized protein
MATARPRRIAEISNGWVQPRQDGVVDAYAPRVDADAVELRVLGCLIEKQRTTPDVYPLSLNALRGACNQTTNRDPVVDYDEPTIRAALERLSRKRWARLASGPGSRAVKYRHLLDEALELSDPELAVLSVLMLRGPQTPGELKQRCERLHAFGSLGAVHETLETLIGRELARRLERRPGQKEERYVQLLGEESAAEAPAEGQAVPPVPAGDRVEDRLAALECEVAALREIVSGLQET